MHGVENRHHSKAESLHVHRRTLTAAASSHPSVQQLGGDKWATRQRGRHLQQPLGERLLPGAGGGPVRWGQRLLQEPGGIPVQGRRLGRRAGENALRCP